MGELQVAHLLSLGSRTRAEAHVGPGSRFGATGEGNPEVMGAHSFWLEDEVLAVSGMSLLCQGLLAP